MRNKLNFISLKLFLKYLPTHQLIKGSRREISRPVRWATLVENVSINKKVTDKRRKLMLLTFLNRPEVVNRCSELYGSVLVPRGTVSINVVNQLFVILILLIEFFFVTKQKKNKKANLRLAQVNLTAFSLTCNENHLPPESMLHYAETVKQSSCIVPTTSLPLIECFL